MYVLEVYIVEFEGGWVNLIFYWWCFLDLFFLLLKFYFMDFLERWMRSFLSKFLVKKVDELLEWVNEIYVKELLSKVIFFGYWRV